MSMESLGGNVPAGRPVSVFAHGVTHVFAIGKDGLMYHWSSPDGLSWKPPVGLPFPNLPACYHAATALNDGSIHLVTIGPGGTFTGGPLIYFRSADGATWTPPALLATAPLSANGNGLAITSTGSQVDAFAVTANGIVRYSWTGAGNVVPSTPPPGEHLSASTPAAVWMKPNVLDVFAIGGSGEVVRWQGNATWTRAVMAPPPGTSPVGLVKSGLVAISPSAGIIELFAVTSGAALLNWTIDETGAAPVTRVVALPSSGPIPDGIPAAVVSGDHIEVFAIGAPPNPFSGGPLLRWRRDGNQWSKPTVISANLAAGGVGAATGSNHVDAFAFSAGTNNSLQHWPAGISAADHDPWTNWASTQQSNPAGHCRPATLEELVAIVKTAEKMPRPRVRAVGSSWSFTGIAKAVDGIGYTVETHGLNKIIDHVITPDVLTSAAPDASFLVHVEAGIVLSDLMKILDVKITKLGSGLAPFTMGGSCGQTLVGAISTSVHGADIDRGPLPNAVRAIHLVGAGGAQHWIEPDQRRITNSAKLASRLGPSVQIHYDDDMFDAAVVSLGALGIIYSVVMEVRTQYDLIETVDQKPWSVVRSTLQWSNFEAKHGDQRFVQVAIDPGNPGDRACYLSTRIEAPVGTPTPPGPPDPLEWFCDDTAIVTAIVGVWAVPPPAIAAPVLTGITALISAALASNPLSAPLVPVVATVGVMGASAVTTATTLIAPLLTALKAGPPGTLASFIGSVLSVDKGFAVAVISYLTKQLEQPGVLKRNIAHEIMAPSDASACAKRGLSIELAFDTRYDAHLSFLDEVIPLLNAEYAKNNVLGGWISLRFCGPAQAILSPQRSARTCMIEIVGVPSVNGTQTLMNEIEDLGRKHQAVPHWGMFTAVSAFSASAVAAAFPRLDTWRKVRFSLTAGGTLHTFDNDFTHAMGLEDAPGSTPVLQQDGWHICKKCLSMVYAAGGKCAAGGAHDVTGSANYRFPFNVWSAPGDRDWRYCGKCHGLVNGMGGACPAGANHAPGNDDYTVLMNGEANWHQCKKCQCLYHVENAATDHCPAGAQHVSSGTDYWIMNVTSSSAGQKGWRTCSRCLGLANVPGPCANGTKHVVGSEHTIPWNSPTAPGQPNWRACTRCGMLAFEKGVCFAGGSHEFTGSLNYTLFTAARQADWKRCKNCHALWFHGSGAAGVCPSSPAGHDLGTDEYFVMQ